MGDPISLGYHEKCFNRGLKRLRKYKEIPYWLKAKGNLIESGNEGVPAQSLLKKGGVFESRGPKEIFEYIRRYSRVSLKNKKRIGIVCINAGLKNTIISLTDLNKNVKAWVSI